MPSLRELVRQEEAYGGRRRAATRTSVLNTAPANAVITTANAKTWLRIDHANDDGLIDKLVTTATSMAERYTGRAFLNQTWEYWLDENDPLLLGDVIELPKTPLSSVTSIVTYDDDNATTTFTSTNYYVDTAEPGRVTLINSADWPTDLRENASLVVTYVAGYGAAIANVDAVHREWIVSGVMHTVAALYEHRGDHTKAPLGLTDTSLEILAPLKVLHL